MKNSIVIRDIERREDLKEVLVNKTSGLALCENNTWILSPNIRSYENDVQKHLPKMIKKDGDFVEKKK